MAQRILRGLFLACTMGLVTTSVSAQRVEVQGLVRDDSGIALPGVNVYVDGGRIGTTTGVDGTYVLTLPQAGDYTVRASAVGYRRQSVDITAGAGQTVILDFVLPEVVIQSGEVVVTASRRAQLASMVPASIAVVSSRELDARNVVSLDEALRYVSGLQMQDNQVNLRGSSGFAYNTGSRVLLLLDGSQLLSPDTDGVPLDIMPMTQIEQIEVLKGPGSALYGSGALGGVINVITKDYPARPTTRLQAYGGAYENVRYDAWKANWPDGGDDLRWFTGARIDHARKLGPSVGGWVSLSYRKDTGYLNFQQSWFYQGYAKLGWTASPKLQMDVLLGGLYRKHDSFLFWNGLSDVLNPGMLALRSTSPSGSSDNFSNQFSFLPTIKFIPDPNSLITSRIRLFGVVIRPIDDITGETGPVSNGTLGVRYGAEVEYTRLMGSAGTLTAGTSFDANTTKSSFYVTSDGDRLGNQPEVAVFGQWEGQATKQVALVAGARFDFYRVDAVQSVTRLSPKIAASYTMGDAMVLRAAYGLGFRAPSLAERFADDQGYIPIFRNPRVKPETSSSAELGLRGWVGRGGWFDGIEWDVAGFWNRYNNFIEPRFVRELVGFQFLNLGEGSRIAGVEANVALVLPAERGRLSVGYTYLDTKDPEGDDLPYRPRHMLVTSGTTRLTSWLEAGADYRYVSIPDKIDSDFAAFVPDADILVATHAVDIRAALKWSRFQFTVLVNNVMDYYYLERPALLAPPRNLVLKLQVDI
jgi:iron complex outermembrane receptor protein